MATRITTKKCLVPYTNAALGEDFDKILIDRGILEQIRLLNLESHLISQLVEFRDHLMSLEPKERIPFYTSHLFASNPLGADGEDSEMLLCGLTEEGKFLVTIKWREEEV